VSFPEFLGYLGGLLVFSTFYLKTMMRLRLVAIASNVVYISYGLIGHLVPILMLHILLFPLNIWRLAEINQLARRVRASQQTGKSAAELIVPHIRMIERSPGEQLFARGDNADCIYYVFKGSAHLVEKNIIVPPGEMIGIVGIFAGEQCRTDTAVCLSEVELGIVSKDKVVELFYKSPDFAAFVVRMLAQRAALAASRRPISYKRIPRSSKCASVLQRVRRTVSCDLVHDYSFH
jgi:CRP/FNR family transcriptional regulator, cyclic AMP receptor protein